MRRIRDRLDRFGRRLRPLAAGVAGALLLTFPVLAAGPERILSFDSRIAVNADAGMLVTETIAVVSAGEQIRRGIFRDFPTSYRDRAGNRYVVGFAVETVTCDGRPEAWHTENLSNGVRVYIGRKDVFLPAGEHTYTLTYRTDRQLGFFKDHDELYWNVTGNDWAFAIDRATAEIELPQGVPGISLLEAYTGPSGAQARNYRAETTSDRTAVFRTTRSLAPHEGLTIVVGWPKGFVHEPSGREKAIRFFADNVALIVAGIGLIIVCLYYVLVWLAVGKDPRGGSIMPIYAPPENLSPAAMRFIAEMGYDDKAFAAAIIDMAVKGCLTISENQDKYTLKKTGAGAGLPPDEQKLAAQLFGSGSSIALERTNHTRIGAAKSGLKTALALAYEKRYFLTNRNAFVVGVALSLAAVLASFLASSHPGEVVFLGIWLSGWSIGVAFLAMMAAKLWRAFFQARSLGNKVGGLGAAIFISLFAVPFLAAEIFALCMLFQDSPALALLPIAVGAINVLFYHLLKAPTLLGRRTLDKIEGFKMFLAATEADRLQRLYPGDRTPALYERFLPYAFALGVEQQWTAQFADVLAAAAAHGGAGNGYHPGWYSGSGWNPSDAGSFAGGIGSSLSGAISSSATAPGSSSGGGGGGSSGGGGGGGGGGGW